MGIVRSALRHLASAPGFTVVAILSLTLGIGPTTAIFSLIDELLLRSLPVPRPEELVLLRVQHGVRGRMSHAGEGQGGVDPVTGREVGTPLSRAIFERLRTTPAPVSHVFASASFSRVSVIAEGVPEPVISAQYVSGDYYAGVGVTPAVGRLIARTDDGASAPPVAVLSYRYWQRRFDGRADAIGAHHPRSTRCRPPSSACPRPASTAPSRSARPSTSRCRSRTSCCSSRIGPARAKPGYWWLSVMARLAPGATAEQSACGARARVPGRRPRRLGVRPSTRSPTAPTIRGCWSSLAPRATTKRRRAQRIPLTAPPGARRSRARGGLRERVDAAGCARRCAPPRLRAATGARRQPRAASSGSASSKRCCCRVPPRSPAPSWRGCRATRSARCTPFGRNPHGRARSAARRPDPRGDGRRLGGLRPGVRAAAGAAGQPHRPGDGVPGRHADARRPAPVVGRARPARRAGGAVARAAGQRRPVLADAHPSRCRRPRLRSARPAVVPHRRHVGRLRHRSRGRAARSDPRAARRRCPACATVTYSRVPLLSRVRQNKSFRAA